MNYKKALLEAGPVFILVSNYLVISYNTYKLSIERFANPVYTFEKKEYIYIYIRENL